MANASVPKRQEKRKDRGWRCNGYARVAFDQLLDHIEELVKGSNFCALRKGERVVDIDTRPASRRFAIPDGTELDLHSEALSTRPTD